ncbi:zinc finger protein 783 isoform X5 [Macaca fascicularis]|uniref:zinc finger protein 783 isoform X5 n=1 Tax=Macaca fascicularis TaxID=9541 RepID=UPI003D15DFBE
MLAPNLKTVLPPLGSTSLYQTEARLEDGEPWCERKEKARTGICRLTSREKPRSDLQRSPFWLSWLLFRWWRRRWNPRLPGYRAWRDAHGQLADCEKTQASWKHPRSSGLDQARGRSKWEEPAGPTGDHCGTPVLRDLSEPQRGVWREGPRDTSQPGLLEGGLARRALGEAPVGVCFLTPGSERWPSSLQALQARLSQLLGAWSSAHLAPSGARASAGRSSAHSRSARIMPHGLSLVLSVPRASRTGPPPPATARRMWPSAPTPAPDAVRPLSTSRRSHPLPHAHRGEALRVRRVCQGLWRPAACPRCWSTGTHTSARSPSSVRSATSASRVWPT